jgi:predicted dehydrogenase
MGRVHTEGVRRLGNVEVAAVAGSSRERAAKFAQTNGIERSTGDYRELLADRSIHAVHVCTPNELHLPMAKAALEAGKHVICEKPLASSVAEAAQLTALARQTGLTNCTFFNIRAYPQVQAMHWLVKNGGLGEILMVQGVYLQDWLLHDTDWNWRVESGPSRTFADIGSHWCDLAEFTTGQKIDAVCTSLKTFFKTRRKPIGSVETFSTARAADTTPVAVATEDYGAMLFQMEGGAQGAVTVSQVSAGRKNGLRIEIYGTKAGLSWSAERPDELWVGHRDEPNKLVIKDPALMPEEARGFADLPGGHSEGYDDTFKQTFRRFYQSVEDRSAPVEFPQFEDGLRQLRVLDAVLESSKTGAWKKVHAQGSHV